MFEHKTKIIQNVRGIFPKKLNRLELIQRREIFLPLFKIVSHLSIYRPQLCELAHENVISIETENCGSTFGPERYQGIKALAMATKMPCKTISDLCMTPTGMDKNF